MKHDRFSEYDHPEEYKKWKKRQDLKDSIFEYIGSFFIGVTIAVFTTFLFSM